MNAIKVVDYDPSWPATFEAERAGILALIGDFVDDIHLVGSTSVPDLAAKPKIDIDAVLRSDDFLPQAIGRVRRMLFRGWLRAHPAEATAYAALKRKLAAEANGDWSFYTGGKSAFVAEMVRRAKAQLIPP